MRKTISVDKTDLELLVEGDDEALFSTRLKSIKIIYENGTEHFEIPDNAQVEAVFEGDAVCQKETLHYLME